MHVDVDQFRVDGDFEDGDRIATARHRLGIGPAQRRPDQLVLHRPPVDKGELLQAVAAVEGRHPGKAGQPHALAFGIDLDRVVAEILAQHLGDAGQHFATVSWTCGDKTGLKFNNPFDLRQLGSAKPEVAPEMMIRPGPSRLSADQDKQARVKAMVEQARKAKAVTIGERVQDANTMAVLWQLGVEFIQGYFVNAPEEVVLG